VLYEFFSSSNLLLGSVVSTAFIGWEDPGGVARIRVTDQGQNNTSMLVDHLIVEGPVSAGAPEPSTAWPIFAGVAALQMRPRSRRTRRSATHRTA
jgi:hypothetical protein